MILALAATLAIVVQDHTSLRAAPRTGAPELTTLWQGDVVEIRGEQAEYLKVYNYRRERGGYLRSEAVRHVALTENDAPELLAVLRFLRESPGSEALGMSYGAAYLKAVPARALTAEPFDSIARMAERLADAASGSAYQLSDVAAHLEVVEQFGVRMRSFERNGRIQVCYDGELFRRVLSLAQASAEERAHAALGLTRPDCIDPNLGPAMRTSLDDERRQLVEQIDARQLTAMTRSRLHARRAGVWASIAYEQARRYKTPAPTASATVPPSSGADMSKVRSSAQHALAELIAVRANDLGDARQVEYVDAVMRVSAIRWAAATAVSQTGPLVLSATSGDPGQTCVALEVPKAAVVSSSPTSLPSLGGHLEAAHRQRPAPLVRRCTYGIVWLASTQAISQGQALVVAVQPLESWRELWVFHETAGTWKIDVISPGADDPEEGYVEFAGFTPGTRRLLIVREVKERGRFRRRFEELRLDDLALVRQASTPELLRDFGRWQDVAWRRDTLALR